MRRSLEMLVLGRIAVFFVSLFLVVNVLFALLFVIWTPRSIFGGQVDIEQIVTDELKLDESLGVQYVNFVARMLSGEFFTSTGVHRFAAISDFIYDDALITAAHFAVVIALSVAAGGIYAYLASRWSKCFTGKTMLALAAVAAVTSVWLVFYVAVWVWAELGTSARSDGFSMLVVSCSFFPVAGASVLVLERAMRFASTNGDGAVTSRMLKAVSDSSLAGVLPILLLHAMTTVLTMELCFSREGIGGTMFSSLWNIDFIVAAVCAYIVSAMLLATFLLLDIVLIYARHRSTGPNTAEPVPSRSSEVGPFAGFNRSSAVRLARAYRKSITGMVALVGLVVLIVASLLAPYIATVENPNSWDSREPNDLPNDWLNPHPPSLDPSPYTGFVHPLGTDNAGRDVYSMLLYDTSGSLFTAFLLAVMALGMGLLAEASRVILSKHYGPVTRPAGWIAWAVADVFLAMPLVIVIFLLYFPVRFFAGIDVRSSADIDFLLLLLLLACVWAPFGKAAATGLLVFDGVSASGGEHTYRINAHVVGRIARVSKFSVLFVYLSLALTAMFTLGDSWLEFGWAESLESAFMWGAFYRGLWWMVVPAVTMIGLTAGLIFVAIDRVEKILEQWPRDGRGPPGDPSIVDERAPGE